MTADEYESRLRARHDRIDRAWSVGTIIAAVGVVLFLLVFEAFVYALYIRWVVAL